MRKLFNVNALAVFVFFMAGLFVSTTMNAQGTDFFFRVDNDDNYDNRADKGITIEGMNHENPIAPLGSGLLIMVAAGAGYTVIRRKRSLKNGITLLLAFALLLGMTQCKKKVVSPEETGTIYMTASTSNGSRTVFVPDMGNGNSGFNWNSTGNEYVVVSGNSTGYLGELSAVAPGGDASINRTEFSGTITAPSANDTKLYFFYLGNGSHSQATGTASTVIDFSEQADGTTSSVTNYLIAVEEISRDKVVIDGSQCDVTIDLKVKTAIAFFRLSGFTGTSNQNETVYLHGTDVYTSAEINFKTGEVIGKDRGYINVGTNNANGVYVSLIDSGTTTAATLQFDSNSKNGSIVFPNGIKGRMFYSDQLEQEYTPLPITATASLPEGALPGLFSVAPGKMVRFSKGNLQYTRPDTSTPWSEGEWSFMENQYDYVELSNWIGNTHIPENAIDVDYVNKTAIGLFGWGCTGSKDTQHGENQDYYMPNNTGYGNDYSQEAQLANAAKYGPTGSFDLSVNNHSDWGWCIDNDEQYLWRTLTIAEWQYLLGCLGGDYRTASSIGSITNARYTKVKVHNTYGLVIFPDEYTQPNNVVLTSSYINYDGDYRKFSDEYVDVLNDDEWAAMELAGAAFLPASGVRDEGDVWGVQEGANYWSCSNVGSSSAYRINFDAGDFYKNPYMRYTGMSVRLVYDPQ